MKQGLPAILTVCGLLAVTAGTFWLAREGCGPFMERRVRPLTVQADDTKTPDAIPPEKSRPGPLCQAILERLKDTSAWEMDGEGSITTKPVPGVRQLRVYLGSGNVYIDGSDRDTLTHLSDADRKLIQQAGERVSKPLLEARERKRQEEERRLAEEIRKGVK